METTDIYDNELWANHVKKFFKDKWRCDDQGRHDEFHNFEMATKTQKWNITSDYIEYARRKFRRKFKLDHTGLTTATWLALPDETIIDIVYLWATRVWQNDDARAATQDEGNHDLMPNLRQVSVAQAARDTHARPTTRAPRHHRHLDRADPRRGDDQEVAGPEGVDTSMRPMTPMLDIAQGITLLLERGEDEAGRNAIAAADIKQFYDNDDVAKAIRVAELHDNIVSQAIIRHRMWPRVGVKGGASTVEIRPKGGGF